METELNKRQELQEAAIEQLRTGRRLILNWGTGVGKSRVAVKSMDKILNSVPEARFLLMVQETNHKRNWMNEFEDALGKDRAEHVLSHTTIDCYASLRKHEATDWDMIVFDEGHHLRSPLRLRILKSMKASRVLVLTATASDRNDGDEMLVTLDMTFGPFESMSFGLQDAIDSSVLKKPEIHLIPIALDSRSREKYESMTDFQDKKKAEYFSLKNSYELREDQENEETDMARIKWLNAGARRKRILGQMKTKVAKLILNEKLKHRKTICFCSCVDQINWLGGKNYVSSKNSQKDNAEALNAFNEGKQGRLFAVGMLQEGQNLKGIEAGLIIQLDGKARPFIQKFGRVMRSDAPVLYILYAKDTQDEGYLDNALKDINEDYIIEHDTLNMEGGKAVICASNPVHKANIHHEQAQKTVWMVDQNSGRFMGAQGQEKTSIKGMLVGIDSTEQPRPYYIIKLQDEFNGTVNTIYNPKRLSISLLSSFMAIRKPAELPVMINISKTGAWPEYTVFSGRTKVRWDKSVLEHYPKDNESKTPYLDHIVSLINEKLQ